METLHPISDVVRLQITAADIKQLLAYASEGLTQQADEVLRVPVEEYLEPRSRHECEEVFKKVPLALGYSFDLPGPNSYRTVEVLGVPVLLTRDPDGEFRALINVCAHRGVCLVQDECGTSRRFRCGYHGWTFDNDGSLVGLTSERKFGRVNRDDFSLVSLPDEEKYGILFVGLTPGNEFDLDEWLGPIAPRLEALRLDLCHPYGHALVEAGNWKAVMDGYLETYHNPWLHPETRNYFETDLGLVEMLGRHALYTTASAKLPGAAEQPEEEWNLHELASKNIYLFPNMSVGANFPTDDLPGLQFGSFRIFPGATFETSVTHFDVFTSRPAETPAQLAALHARYVETLRVIRDEDYPTVSTQMKAWTSGGLRYMTYGRNEFTNQMWLRRGLQNALGESPSS